MGKSLSLFWFERLLSLVSIEAENLEQVNSEILASSSFFADIFVFQEVEEVSRGTIVFSQILVNQMEKDGEGKWREPW